MFCHLSSKYDNLGAWWVVGQKKTSSLKSSSLKLGCEDFKHLYKTEGRQPPYDDV